MKIDRRKVLGHLFWGSAALASQSVLGNTATQRPQISLGIDVLEAEGFKRIRGKRVGLLTNPAGVNRWGESTISILRKGSGYRLVSLFGPEHGIYGDEKANKPIEDRIDPATRLPVYSLYGKYRKPSPEMLENIDALIIDLQDLGVRSYTYISCMKYAMEACFEQNKEIIILDRPNPLGGLKIDGPSMEKEWMSYVGAFQIPYVYGLTIAELAYYSKMTQGVLNIEDSLRKKGRLTIVPMKEWTRSMMWPDTGLKWIPTSPAIPDLSAAMGYAMTGLGTQIGAFSHGYGTQYPFRLLQFPGKSPEEIAQRLSAQNIEGVGYKILLFTMKNQERRGTYVTVENWDRLNPTEISFHMMKIACEWMPQNPFGAASMNNEGLFNKHVGNSSIFNGFKTQGANFDFTPLLQQWKRYHSSYRNAVRQFYLYKA